MDQTILKIFACFELLGFLYFLVIVITIVTISFCSKKYIEQFYFLKFGVFIELCNVGLYVKTFVTWGHKPLYHKI